MRSARNLRFKRPKNLVSFPRIAASISDAGRQSVWSVKPLFLGAYGCTAIRQVS
jgi:hypothetical protein